jgi:3-oxoacyl-[acyl-carrier protein] reductase
MAESLEGQVALVTGASRGIGRAIACQLARLGAHVYVNYRRDERGATETVEQIQGFKRVASLARFDVADDAGATAGIKAVVQSAGRLDILVNNAGMTIDNLVLRYETSEWDQVMAVNLRGTFQCTRTAARTMVRARYGRIVNVSSVIGLMGNAGQGAYAAAKAGIIGFTKSMARELAARSITVNAVAPGLIETDMLVDLPEGRRTEYLNVIPVGRLGTVDDVADAVAFLARRDAGYVTGQVIGVNGGLYM